MYAQPMYYREVLRLINAPNYLYKSSQNTHNLQVLISSTISSTCVRVLSVQSDRRACGLLKANRSRRRRDDDDRRQ